MSFTLYDRAVTEKIKKWILDSNMVVLSPDETRRLFTWKATTDGDKPLTLPLISINRNRDVSIKTTSKQMLSHRGKIFNSEKGVSDHLNAIPMTLSYVINIYTRYLEEADEYVRNFVFQLINYPKIEIQIPYNNSQLTYTSYLTLQPEISDNSDIPERLIAGQFSRMTLAITLNDAYLFSYNHKHVSEIESLQIETKTVEEIEPSTDEIRIKGC
jgi:hypothetical protein